jgi:uncharacterized protein YwgA
MHKRLIPLVLAYAGDEEPIEGRTRLQKMVFVMQQELVEEGVFQEEDLYEFFAYDYGPFSKELAEAIDEMIEVGLLEEETKEYDEEGNLKYLYELQTEGRELAEQELDETAPAELLEKAQNLKQRYNDDLSLPEVIDEVYAEYPEYAEDSVY